MLIPSVVNARTPLVKLASVKPWTKGEVSIINCEISVPFLTAFTSESDAKLTYLIPKGTKVKQGQLIAEQQNFYYLQQLSRLRQDLSISDSDLNFKNKEYNRLLELEGGLVSAANIEKAVVALKHAQAKYKQVNSEINEIEHRISRLKFYAPKDGTVVDVFSELGEFLNQGRKVLSFLSASDKEVNCQVPVSQFDQNKIAKFHLLAANKLPLTMTRVSPAVESINQFVNVYLKSDTEAFSQFLGQRIKVEMSITNNKLTRLPVDGVNLANEGDYVWRVNSEGKVSKVTVKLLANQNDYFLAESSLMAGDQVVTLGKSGLSEEQTVNISTAQGAI